MKPDKIVLDLINLVEMGKKADAAIKNYTDEIQKFKGARLRYDEKPLLRLRPHAAYKALPKKPEKPFSDSYIQSDSFQKKLRKYKSGNASLLDNLFADRLDDQRRYMNYVRRLNNYNDIQNENQRIDLENKEVDKANALLDTKNSAIKKQNVEKQAAAALQKREDLLIMSKTLNDMKLVRKNIESKKNRLYELGRIDPEYRENVEVLKELYMILWTGKADSIGEAQKHFELIYSIRDFKQFVSKRFGEMEGRIKVVDDKYERLTGRMATLETEQASALSSLSSQVSSISSEVSALRLTMQTES